MRRPDVAGDPAGRAAWIVTAVSLLYAAAGAYWMIGGRGFPYGAQNDPLAAHQLLPYGLTQTQGAPWVAGLGLTGAAIALLLTRTRRRSAESRLLVALGWTQAAAYTLVIPDGRLLVAAAHLPILLIGRPFGWPSGVTITSQLPWPVVHQALLTGYGVLWAATAVLMGRRLSSACQRCGRTSAPSWWSDPARNRQVARWAVAVAVTVPAIYAATRVAWALGLPLGVSREFLTEQRAESPTIFVAGAFLALLALAGGALTLGLVMRWGEVYPRWLPRLGSRPVRPRTAIAPAAAVAILITAAGVGWVRAAVAGLFPEGALDRDWATTAPGMLWPLWGLALGAATYAYHVRRRGRCRACGRT